MPNLTLTVTGASGTPLVLTLAAAGAKGDPGAPGTNGANATVAIGSVTTLAAGASATVTNTGTSSAAVLAFGIPAGPAGANGTNGTNGLNGTNGAPGAAATVTVGTVSTGAAGSSATVTNAGTANAAILNFAIPRGNTGATASVAVGTTTTGAAGTNASVTNSGTTSAAVFNFTIPRGATGATGATGPAGAAATITVGTVTTGAAGSSVVVTNSGTTSAAVLNFTIPRGDTGASGSGATLPTATGAGQAPVSTGAGTTYTAQNIATQAELDAVASTLTETGLAVADHETRLDALDTTTRSAGLVYAGPTTGSAAAPAFRALVASDVPALDAAKITTGTLAPARLGSGTADATTFLRGDGTFAVPSGAALTVKDEGTNLTTAATSLDFVGAGVVATNTGGAVTVTIAGGSGGDVGDLTDRMTAAETELKYPATTSAPSGAHRYWRLFFLNSVDNASCGLAELQFRATPGGANLVAGQGTPLSSGDHSAGTVPKANAFNGVLTDAWNSPDVGQGQWIGYDFGAGNSVRVAQVAVAPFNSFPTHSPKHFLIQYSDDAVTWTSAWRVNDAVTWPASTFQTFTDPQYGGTTTLAQDVATALPRIAAAEAALGLGGVASVNDAGGYGAHAYWRFRWTDNYRGDYAATVDLQFRSAPGGANRALHGLTGTALASSILSAAAAADKAFDGSELTFWHSDSGTVTAGVHWVGFHFTTPTVVSEVAERIPSGGNYWMRTKSGVVEYSDDGAAWSLAWTVSGQNAAEGATSVYTTPSYVAGPALTLPQRVAALEAPSAVATLTDGATITWATGGARETSARVTLGGNRTLAVTGAASGQRGTLLLTQDGTGSRTLTLPSGSITETGFALSTAAGAKDRLDYVYDGTSYWWSIRKAYA